MTYSAKHTPGLWHVSDLENTRATALVFADGDKRLIADCGGIHRRTQEEMDANAKLIAAAPDMAEALSGVFLTGPDKEGNYLLRIEPKSCEAKAAIVISGKTTIVSQVVKIWEEDRRAALAKAGVR